MKNTRKSQSGFSLLEMLVVVAVLVIIMAAVMESINTVQKRYATEEQRLDLAQESREFFDQMSRDLHQAGYPNAKMYGDNVLMVPNANDSRNAVGIVRFAYDDIWFEGDIDGDGNVDVVRYALQADPLTGQCPCRISRSVFSPKANATAPMAQVSTNWVTELQDVVNSGRGANGFGNPAFTISGTTSFNGTQTANNVIYAAYRDANVFTAFDESGITVAPTDFATNPTALKTIRTIKININVLGRQIDQQTKLRPTVTLSASVRLPAN